MSADPMEQLKSLMSVNGDVASIEKILDKLLVKDKNLILKSDIENSRNFVMLYVIYEELKFKGLKRSAKTLETFLLRYIEVRVSRDRLSRKEVLDAISAVKREQSNSITSKLLGIDEKNKSV